MKITALSKGLLITSLILSTTATFAARHYKDGDFKDRVFKDQAPCPDPFRLKDGFYVGAQAGYDNFRDHENVNATVTNSDGTFSIPVYTTTLSANGWLGGLYAGYGKYLRDVYYLGGEVFGNLSNNPTTQNNVVTAPSPFTTVNTRFTARNSYGLSFLPGIKVNDTSLLYVRLGYKWSGMRYQSWTNSAEEGVAYNSKTVTEGGFNYGVGIETLLYQNWSMRGEYSHTNYSSFNASTVQFEPSDVLHAAINPSDNLFTLGLTYHIA